MRISRFQAYLNPQSHRAMQGREMKLPFNIDPLGLKLPLLVELVCV